MRDLPTGPVPLNDQLCFAIYSAGIAVQRLYKPLLDQLGLTYPQYLVLNVLWRADEQTVGSIAAELSLESSTLTPLLKRLEAGGLVRRVRNPANERQVLVSLTPSGRALRSRGGCLGDALLTASGATTGDLADLTQRVGQLRDAVYGHVDGWGGADDSAPRANAS